MPANDLLEQHEVVVLGAGLAGLAAAHQLSGRGVEVCLLEARERVGGRAWTVRATLPGGDLTEPLELGAEFVHGDAPRTRALADAAGAQLIDATPSARWWLHGSLVERPDLEQAVQGAVAAASDSVRTTSDHPFASALDAACVPEPARSLALEFVESFQAADGARLSARALLDGAGVERSRRLAGGFGPLCETLAASLPRQALRLGHEVRSIRWRRGEVEVRTAPSSPSTRATVFRCRRAIIALPLPALRSIRFDPPLQYDPAKRAAFCGLAMGRATRIALCFREPFWEGRLRAPFFVRVPHRAFPVFWSGPAENTRMIVAWAGGPSSDALMASGEGPADLGATAVAILAEVFGLRAAALHDLLECTAHHDWMRDAWSHGVYSYPRVGYSQSAHLLGEPVDETLFIAGEAACEPPGSGTVEGALASGQRAASDVAALL